MEVESFEQACGLDREALDALLASEHPEQRVWAIWAIALSLGDRAGAFAQRVDGEPDPGVRRTLAVILAGHGEYDLLVALARHDPSMAVRESAIHLVTRLAGGSIAHLRAIVEEAAGPATIPAGSGIHIAILGAIGPGAPDFLTAIANRLLDAHAFDVQAEAFEALLRIDTAATRARARLWFRSQLDPWTHVDRWLRAAGPSMGATSMGATSMGATSMGATSMGAMGAMGATSMSMSMSSLAEAVADLAMNIRGRVLMQLQAPPWPVVEVLIGTDRELLRSLLGRTDIAIPARVLAQAVRDGAHEGFAARLAAQLAAAARGRALLADLRAAIELDHDGSALSGLAARARSYADALELADRHEVFVELRDAHPVEHLLGLENAVARWLGELDAPADLLPLLPDLRAYCEDRLAGLGAGPRGRQLWQLFRDLLTAIDAINPH